MDKRTEILDAAERRARLGGYNGFSFRDIAADVGIKSASVHYHFPTKDDLAEAVALRYLERTREWLGKPEDHSSEEAFDKIAEMFLHANEVDDLMCLCGVFGAEAVAIPPEVARHVGNYFDLLIEWLAAGLPGPDSKTRAEVIVAALEGGLIVSRARCDQDQYRRIVERLRREML